MRRFIVLFLLVLLVAPVGIGTADFNFDDLFGDDLLLDFEDGNGELRPEEALLVGEGIEAGGSYSINLSGSRSYSPNKKVANNYTASFNSSLFWDFRPDPDFRIFAKAGIGLEIAKDMQGKYKDPLNIEIQELFADFNYNNEVFFRAGKQNVKWGVGYFFSPADVINVGRLDPQNPEASRAGALALKAHYPFKSNNLYLYTLLDGAERPSEIALAPKLEYVVGKSEVGLGGFYQQGKSPMVMATISSSLGELSLFGEAALGWNSKYGTFNEVEVPIPLPKPVYEIVEQKGPYMKATLGGTYTYGDLTGILQYYFNGEGYHQQGLLQELRSFVLGLGDPPFLIGYDDEDTPPLNHSESGRHYLAATLAWNKILQSKVSATVVLLTNLSDQSGMINSTLSLPKVGNVSPNLGASFNFGKQGTQYGGPGRNTTIFASITIGRGSF